MLSAIQLPSALFYIADPQRSGDLIQRRPIRINQYFAQSLDGKVKSTPT